MHYSDIFSLNALSSQLPLAMTNWCWIDRRKFCLLLLCSLWPNTSRVYVCRWDSVLYNQFSYALHYLQHGMFLYFPGGIWQFTYRTKGQMDLRCSYISNISVGHHCESMWLTWTCCEICVEKYFAIISCKKPPFAWIPIEITGLCLQKI